jgi:BirA family transcriptional regulator, biotin operon repressor / biotin---[acetyl-CoA-carboxylase] ligase
MNSISFAEIKNKGKPIKNVFYALLYCFQPNYVKMHTKLQNLTKSDSIKNTVFIGKVLYHFNELPSTNTYASELLSESSNFAQNTEGPIEGVVVSTFNQTFGRGQMGSRWVSEPNMNLAVSIILKPHFLQARQQFHLNKAVALAVCDFISHEYSEKNPSLKNDVTVKWANDIYVKNNKIAGILIQNTLSGVDIQSTIIGIGININQTRFDDLPNATSLKLETQKSYILEEMLEKLCIFVEQRYLQLKNRNFDKLHNEYLDKLYRMGEDAIYQYPNGDYFSGRIIGVGDNGKLTVLTKSGVENFDVKEVKFVQ